LSLNNQHIIYLQFYMHTSGYRMHIQAASKFMIMTQQWLQIKHRKHVSIVA